MNPLQQQLIEQSTDNILGVKQLDPKRLTRLILTEVIKRIDREIDSAYEQGEPWLAATLESLSIEILDDFDVEIDCGNNSGTA